MKRPSIAVRRILRFVALLYLISFGGAMAITYPSIWLLIAAVSSLTITFMSWNDEMMIG